MPQPYAAHCLQSAVAAAALGGVRIPLPQHPLRGLPAWDDLQTHLFFISLQQAEQTSVTFYRQLFLNRSVAAYRGRQAPLRPGRHYQQQSCGPANRKTQRTIKTRQSRVAAATVSTAVRVHPPGEAGSKAHRGFSLFSNTENNFSFYFSPRKNISFWHILVWTPQNEVFGACGFTPKFPYFYCFAILQFFSLEVKTERTLSIRKEEV